MQSMSQLSLQKAKANLQQWEHANRHLIDEYEQCIKINQPLASQPQLTSSPYFIMRKIKQMRCEVCHYADGFKYFRSQAMFDPSHESTCLVFLLCQSCYLRDGLQLPVTIDKDCYTPMHVFLSSIEAGLANFRQEAQFSESIVRKYDFFEDKLSKVIWQLIKAVEKKRSIVCKKVFDEISTLRQFYLGKKSQEIYDTLLRECSCDCKDQCCYCDYSAKNEEYMKTNCKYYDLKKQQNEVIKKIHLLNTINSNFDGVHHDTIFNGIVKQVEMVIIQSMQHIEATLNQIITQTEQFSLLNTHFLQQIVEDYTLLSQNGREGDGQELVRECKADYIKQGVLNHLTSDHFPSFSNSITSISLNYMPEESILRSKLKMLKKLSNIEVGCNEIGEMLVEDTIKSHQEWKEQANQNNSIPQDEIKAQQPENNPLDGRIPSKNQQNDLINLSSFKQLKKLSFNCNIPYKNEFFDSIEDLKLEQLYINWNFAQNFEKFNESTHFVEDKCIINSMAPSSSQFEDYSIKHQLKNIWIGNCGSPEFEDSSTPALSDEINRYLNILSQSESIRAIMFGQFDGRSRRLADLFYQQLIHKTAVKALFFNKIQFQSSSLTTILQNNTLIQVLYFNSCEGLDKAVIDQICDLQHLAKLSIVQIKQICFKKCIPTLQTLILQSCFELYESNLALLLSDCKLKALSLFQCQFFEDDLLREVLQQQISNKSELRYLNLGYTLISNETLSLINHFPSLKSLHLGGTALNLSQLLSQINRGKFANLRKLEKLSLKQMKEVMLKTSPEGKDQISEFYNDIFSNILEYFALLSHVDISGNRIINERAIRFGLNHLAYLTVTDTLYALKKDAGRIDHSGPECPFAKGRLNLGLATQKRKDSDSKEIPKKMESSIIKYNDSLKIIY